MARSFNQKYSGPKNTRSAREDRSRAGELEKRTRLDGHLGGGGGTSHWGALRQLARSCEYLEIQDKVRRRSLIYVFNSWKCTTGLMW